MSRRTRPPSTPVLQPATPQPAERITGFDLARSLAILGMIVAHFSLVMAEYRDARDSWMHPVLTCLDGRVAATFVVLAGIGFSLLSRKAIASGDPQQLSRMRWVLWKRGLFLLILGFINLVIWPGDILRVYGVSFCLGACCLQASSRMLWGLAFTFWLGFVLLCGVLDFEQNWDWQTLTYADLWTTEGILRNLFFDGFRSVFPWTGFFFLGIWIGRLDLRQPTINHVVLRSSVAIALVGELLSITCISMLSSQHPDWDDETVKALVGTESMPAFPLFIVASGGAAVAVISFCVWITEFSPLRRWLYPVIVTGQLALTWYMAHILIGLGTIVTLEQTSQHSLPFSALCGVLFYVAAMALSCLWKRWFSHGPLEMMLRGASS